MLGHPKNSVFVKKLRSMGYTDETLLKYASELVCDACEEHENP